MICDFFFFKVLKVHLLCYNSMYFFQVLAKKIVHKCVSIKSNCLFKFLVVFFFLLKTHFWLLFCGFVMPLFIALCSFQGRLPFITTCIISKWTFWFLILNLLSTSHVISYINNLSECKQRTKNNLRLYLLL